MSARIISKLFRDNQKVINVVNEIVKVIALTLGLALISQMQLYLYIVPLTLQTSYVALMGLVVSKKTSVRYLSLYIGLALLGAPMLTGMQGVSKGNIVDFGFVIGFVAMACTINYLWNKVNNHNLLNLIGVITISNLVVYALGFGWVLLLGNKMAITMFIPFIIFDIMKMTVVISLYNLIANKKILNK